MASAKQIRAGSAFIEILLKKTAFSQGLKNLEADLAAVGKRVTAVGAAIFAGGLGFVSPIIAAVKSFVGVADNLQDMSERTGVAASTLSILGFAATQTGTDMEAFEKAIIGQDKLLRGFAEGAAKATDVFNRLGIDAESFAKLNQEQRFLLLVQRLSQVQDVGLRAGLSMEVFGKSAFALGPFISGGIKGFQEFAKEAQRLGIIVSDADAAKGGRLADSLVKLSLVLQGLGNKVAAPLLDAINDLSERFSGVIGLISNYLDANRKIVTTAVALGGAVIAVGAGIATFGAIILAASASVSALGAVLALPATLITGLATAIGFVLNPVFLLITALTAGGVAFLRYTATGRAMVNFLLEAFKGFFQTALKIFKGVAKALAAGDINLAANILWKSLQQTFLEGKLSLVQITESLRKSLRDAWINIMTGIAEVVAVGWADLSNIWTVGLSSFEAGLAALGFGIDRLLDNLSIFFAKAQLKLTAKTETEKDKQDLRDKLALIDKIADAQKNKKDAAFISQLENINRTTTSKLQESKAKMLQDLQALEQEKERLIANGDAADKERLKQINEQVAKGREELGALLGKADVIGGLKDPGALNTKTKDILTGLDFTDNFNDKIGKAAKDSGRILKTATASSFTEAARIAQFQVAKKNDNEKLEKLTGDQNVLLKQQLAALRDLGVADDGGGGGV